MDEIGHTSANVQSPSFAKSYFRFQWNSEPNHIICIFPYVIGLSNQSIEIRLLVNGNLVNSITMSNIKLIANKVRFYLSIYLENKRIKINVHIYRKTFISLLITSRHLTTNF